jgi:cysteine desulfurase
MDRIYFDYNATTPLAAEVVAAMQAWLGEGFGNPSSHHWAGQRAREAVECSRSQVAKLLRCDASEIVFTSGGTEANNAALVGTFFSRHGKPTPHFIVSSVEHPSINKTCAFLERLGAVVTRVRVDRHGLIDPDDIRSAIQPATVLVSVMHANNEVGTLQPIGQIATIARERGVLMHTDAAQSVGKIPVEIADLGVDLLTVAGHKMYAPQGVGALFVRRGVELEPLLHGADHEQGRRAGTENVLEIVGLGAASQVAQRWVRDDSLRELRDRFWQLLQARFGNEVVLNGHPEQRLPNTLNVSFPGRRGQDLLARMPNVAASTGSACHAGDYALSPVLKAMQIDEAVGLGAIRFSLGRNSTLAEVESACAQLAISWQ